MTFLFIPAEINCNWHRCPDPIELYRLRWRMEDFDGIPIVLFCDDFRQFCPV